MDKTELEKYKELLKSITELLCERSDQMNANPFLEKSVGFMNEVNIYLDEVNKIKKEVGDKNFDKIKYVLKDKYAKKKTVA